ncbi:hypothetical protein BXZ70DRAFT_1077169 [Cristinia sonorae]|uniref:Uncharacterized protein n=1 Tax=Cristinia sonorae TaxID=1940300 RepID=A0A8K0UR55_9AGAR|nr:hypothetical protein BXZ70DRAFT_1077169 [Cristinia sonorae]
MSSVTPPIWSDSRSLWTVPPLTLRDLPSQSPHPAVPLPLKPIPLATAISTPPTTVTPHAGAPSPNVIVMDVITTGIQPRADAFDAHRLNKSCFKCTTATIMFAVPFVPTELALGTTKSGNLATHSVQRHARELLGDRRAMIEMSLDSPNKSDIVIIKVTFPPHACASLSNVQPFHILTFVHSSLFVLGPARGAPYNVHPHAILLTFTASGSAITPWLQLIVVVEGTGRPNDPTRRNTFGVEIGESTCKYKCRTSQQVDVNPLSAILRSSQTDPEPHNVLPEIRPQYDY